MRWLGLAPANWGSSIKKDYLHQCLQLVWGWTTPLAMIILCWVTPTQSISQLGREITKGLEALVGIMMWNLQQNLAKGECSVSWIKVFSWTNTNNHNWSREMKLSAEDTPALVSSPKELEMILIITEGFRFPAFLSDSRWLCDCNIWYT